MYQLAPLPRRAHLGLRLGPFVRGRAFASVAQVTDDGPAGRAGLRAGDLILAADAVSLTEPHLLGAAVRACGCDRPLLLSVRRADETLALEVQLEPLPRESHAGIDVDHGECPWSSADGTTHRLRTIVTKIQGESRALAPAILYLQGIGCESCESPLDPRHGPSLLTAELARCGFVVQRYERSGVGDSEGPPAASLDFFAEVAQARAALAALRARTDVDPRRIHLYGHSLGGMVAPLLAGPDDGVAGVIAFGTSGFRWRDCVLATTRRQRRLGGLDGDALDEQMRAWSTFGDAIYGEGLTPAEAFARAPELRRLESAQNRGDSMFGRHVSFLQQLDRVDLAALWRSVGVPVLVLHGEYDWICSAEEGRVIVAAVEDGGGRASFAELPRVGHDLRAHESLITSFKTPQAGVTDGHLASVVAAWIAANQTDVPSHAGSGKTQP